MLIILYFFVIILGLISDKSKIVRLLQYALIIIIFVFNSWNQDDVFYRGIYSGYYGRSHEIGFDLVCHFFYSRGVTYEAFRACYVAVATVLFITAFHIGFRDSKNRAYSLLLLYPLLPLVELLRNFMAIAIVVCGVIWYFSRERDKIKDKIIFLIFIFLGAMFHYNVLFFVILLLPSEIKPQKNTYVLIALLSLGSILICNVSIFKSLLSLVFHSQKILGWFNSENRIGLGIVIVLAFHLASFLIYNYIYTIYYHREKKSLTQNNRTFAQRVYSLNVFSFALIGLYTYNMEFFSRLYIFVLLINGFHVATITQKVRTRNIQILGWMQILYHIVMFFYFCQPFNKDGIMSFVLRNNYLFP